MSQQILVIDKKLDEFYENYAAAMQATIENNEQYVTSHGHSMQHVTEDIKHIKRLRNMTLTYQRQFEKYLNDVNLNDCQKNISSPITKHHSDPVTVQQHYDDNFSFKPIPSSNKLKYYFLLLFKINLTINLNIDINHHRPE